MKIKELRDFIYENYYSQIAFTKETSNRKILVPRTSRVRPSLTSPEHSLKIPKYPI